MRRRFLMLYLIALLPSAALADAKSAPGKAVETADAWARATVAGQGGTGAFMTLTAREDLKLIGAASAVAGVVELHEMTMAGNLMKMRPVTALELPAGRAVRLSPGGHHVMLMDLKRPLAAGEKITVELRFETRDKRLVTQPVEVEVRMRAPEAHKH